MSRVHLHTAHHGHGGVHDPDDHEGPHGGPEHKSKSPWHGRLDLLITVLLGLAAITGAFAALRNEQRNHEATTHFSEGISNVVQSGYQYTEGGQAFVRDQNLFVNFATAVHNHQLDLARYIQNHLMSSVPLRHRRRDPKDDAEGRHADRGSGDLHPLGWSSHLWLRG